jgi:hypothetical protein
MWTDRSASPSARGRARRASFSQFAADLYVAKAKSNQCIGLEAKILGLGRLKSAATSKINKTNLSSDRNWNNDNF